MRNILFPVFLLFVLSACTTFKPKTYDQLKAEAKTTCTYASVEYDKGSILEMPGGVSKVCRNNGNFYPTWE